MQINIWELESSELGKMFVNGPLFKIVTFKVDEKGRGARCAEQRN